MKKATVGGRRVNCAACKERTGELVWMDDNGDKTFTCPICGRNIDEKWVIDLWYTA